MLFNVIKVLIDNGRAEGLEKKIDVFYAAGKLTNKEYKRLTDTLSEKA